jgi:terminal uridylyltransferase
MDLADFQILTQRPDRAILALNELCREGDDDLTRAPRSSSPAPRAMSQPRGGYPAPGGSAAFRSQSQLPFDRFATPMYDNGRRGRQSEGSVPEQEDISAQEQWLASQGPNLGNIGSLGLGFPEGFDGQGQSQGGRGRDTNARGLENPAGPYGHGRRSTSKFNHDDPGTGSISAPLSPHRLYAQLEMGKGPAAGWPAYDPRQTNLGVPAPGGPSSYPNPNPNAGRSTSSSHVAPGSGAPPSRSASSSNSNSNGSGNLNKAEPIAHPVFQPFSPPIPTSKLRHMNAGESSMTSFISPSTLLSPPQAAASLPPQSSVDNLTNDFGKMGVAPPGKENEQKKGTKGKGGRTTPGWQSKATSPDLSKGSS